MNHADHSKYFYEILSGLRTRLGEVTLTDCHGSLNWPQRGVYFFFEPGEQRADGVEARVVRVGTHALKDKSQTTIWNRLHQHKGTGSGGGNHRGSVFRKHVGHALLQQCPSLGGQARSTWGIGSNAPSDVRLGEIDIEKEVSVHICSMPFLWVNVSDPPGPSSQRGIIERNSIALLSRIGDAGFSADPASEQWLGNKCIAESVRKSALWNVNHTKEPYDPGFLAILEECVRMTEPL